MTAEHKDQVICSECKYKSAYKNRDVCPKCETKLSDMESPTYLHYIYYHCTKRKVSTCPEGSVQEYQVDNSMAEHIENNFAISKTLSDWCVKHIDELDEDDKQNEFETKAVWLREKTEKQKEYDQLVQMRMKGLIDDDNEFMRLKAGLKASIERIDKTLTGIGGGDQASLEEAKKAFDLAIGIATVFRTGTFDEKQEALSALGSNLTLKDKKLNVTNKELFSIMTKGLLEAKAFNRMFEPTICKADNDETEVFASVRSTLLPG